MLRSRSRRVRMGRILLCCVLALPMTAACGGSNQGEVGTSVRRTQGPLRTVQPAPSGATGKQTASIERGTTGDVGGLRLGVTRAGRDKGIVAVLSGPEVPEERGEDWTVSGKAGTTKKLDNGYTVSIDKIVNAKGDSAETGSAGGSVTVTVTPPA